MATEKTTSQLVSKIKIVKTVAEKLGTNTKQT